MRILIACEYSARVRDAFRERVHDAWSVDLLPTEGNPRFHIQADVLDVINDGWEMMIAHPDCTYLCSSGLHWNKRRPGRQQKTDEALVFVRQLLDAPIHYIALENPIGCISTQIRKPDQYIQPFNYGEDASKKTGIWLKNLPLLEPTRYIEPRIVDGKKRWSNQTDSGQNRLTPSDDRWKNRARTYQGWADAMADQWGQWIEMRQAA